jgi:hypothetical protein
LPNPLIPGIVSTDIIFPFIYMCPEYLYHIHPPSLFPTSSPHSEQYHSTPGRTCTTLLVCNSV